MKLQITITSKNEKPFQNNEGVEIPYFRYKGEKADGCTIQIGSMSGEHEIGDSLEMVLEKTETKRGFSYKEIIQNPVEQE